MNETRKRETTGTRDKILRSAEKLIGKKGYAQVSVRDIAEDAGVSLGQITYHFSSKDALFMEIVRNLTSSFLEDFNKTPKSRSSGREKAAEILRHSKKALLKSPDKRKMLMDFSNMAIWSREYADEFNSLFSEMERAIKGRLRFRRRRGLLGNRQNRLRNNYRRIDVPPHHGRQGGSRRFRQGRRSF